MNGPTILVIGSAHLDVLAQMTGDENTIDKIGDVRITIGGTGCNVAVNLAALGTGVSFYTAMNRSPVNHLIIDYLKENRVTPLVEEHPSMPIAAFCAHINRDGELVSAVSSMPVDRIIIDQDNLLTAAVHVAAIVVDCNLSQANIDTAIGIAHSLFIPSVIAGVSEEKAGRILGLANRPNFLVINDAEFAYLSRKTGLSTPRALASRVADTLIVTLGADGVLVVSDEGPQHLPADVMQHYGNTLGAGDAFLAGFVFHHIVNRKSIVQAAELAQRTAAAVLARANCNLTPTDAFMSKLDIWRSRAEVDAMTGLATRASAEANLARLFDHGADSLTHALLIDVDRFKQVNDEFGHEAGDRVLSAVGEAIKACLRDDDIAARWGGEEFLVVFQGQLGELAISIAERIRTHIEETISRPDATPLTVSIGVGHARDMEPFYELLQRADAALLEAKRAGRNRCQVAA